MMSQAAADAERGSDEDGATTARHTDSLHQKCDGSKKNKFTIKI